MPHDAPPGTLPDSQRLTRSAWVSSRSACASSKMPSPGVPSALRLVTRSEDCVAATWRVPTSRTRVPTPELAKASLAWVMPSANWASIAGCPICATSWAG